MDVLFVSDIDMIGLPKNARLLKLSFKELTERVVKQLGRSVSLANIRRLCDFKPMWGKVFAEYLTGYRYWAFGDCDVVYGRQLGDVIKEVVDGDYDVASLREKWVSGGLTFLKNTETVRSLYARADDLDRVLQADEYSCFDECRVSRFAELYSGAISIFDCHREAGDSFTAILWRAKDLKFYHQDRICENPLSSALVYVRDGRVFWGGTEVPMFHFVRIKARRYFSYRDVPVERLNVPYVIDDTGFYVGMVERILRPVLRRIKKLRAILMSVIDNGFAFTWRRLMRINGR